MNKRLYFRILLFAAALWDLTGVFPRPARRRGLDPVATPEYYTRLSRNGSDWTKSDSDRRNLLWLWICLSVIATWHWLSGIGRRSMSYSGNNADLSKECVNRAI
ncbi:hypothetical protein BJY01DRAFT_15803 [Aspergillus pseudoustus]|uniref:Uncharacterized protein n=1 Tax=Aspergillus pseudoustus TaxID=1810923 RepID=A0ABR4JL59_9EURO